MAHNSTLKGERGGINFDTDLPELSQMDILQARIRTANLLLALDHLPTVHAHAKKMLADAEAEVLKLVEQEPTVGERAAVAYMDAPSQPTDSLPEKQNPRWKITRAWADKHLNSDDDLKNFTGGAEII